MNGTISVYNNVTVSASGGNEVNFTATDLSSQTSWVTAALNILVSNGATPASAGEKLTINVAVAGFPGQTAATALRSCSRPFTFQLPSGAAANAIFTTSAFPVAGNTLYIWFDNEPWSYARTVTLNVVGVDAGGSGGLSGTAVYQYSGANANAITPTDQSSAALAYPANGVGLVYTWNTTTHVWQ